MIDYVRPISSHSSLCSILQAIHPCASVNIEDFGYTVDQVRDNLIKTADAFENVYNDADKFGVGKEAREFI
jgi:hypothetical protein